MKTFFEDTLANRSFIASAAKFFQDEKSFMVNYFEPIVLDSEDKVFISIQKHFYNDDDKLVYIFANPVLKKIDTFPLPKSVQEKLKNTIRYMDDQLLEWITTNLDLLLSSLVYFPQALQWTNRGKVDILKTVTNIVNNEKAPVYDRFLLCCRFCIEKKVRILWNRLLDDSRHKFLRESDEQYCFWMYHLRNQIPPSFKSDLQIPNEQTFDGIVEESFDKNNLLALKYFWDRLSLPTKLNRFESFREDLEDEFILFFQSRLELPQDTFLDKNNQMCDLQATLNNWLWQEDLGLQLECYKLLLSDIESQQSVFIDVIYLLEAYPVKDKLRHLVILIWRRVTVKDHTLFDKLREVLEMDEIKLFLTLMKDLPADNVRKFLESNNDILPDLYEQDKFFVVDELIALFCETEAEFALFKNYYLLEDSDYYY